MLESTLVKINPKAFLKALGRKIGRIVLDRRIAAQLTPPKNVLVIRWDGKIGDAVVSSFFYEEAEKLERVTVTVITTPELAELHRAYFGAHKVLVTSSNPGLIELCKLGLQLRGIDTVIHLVDRIRTRELFFLSFVKPRNVFSLDDDIRWVNGKMRDATTKLSFSQKYIFVLHQLGASSVDARYRLPTIALSKVLAPLTDVQRVVFNPFASRPDKSIGGVKAARLLCLIADRLHSCEISILHSPDTADQAIAMMRGAARSNVKVAEGITTLFDAIAAVKNAVLVISVDSAIVHIADGLNKKLIAICPSQSTKYNPWLPRPALSTRIVLSPQDVHRYRRTGKKDMDTFDDSEVLGALTAFTTPEHSVDTLLLRARIVSGLGAASRNLKLQLPLIAQEFPEVSACHSGSINVEFPQALTVIDADYCSPPLAWIPERLGTEVFEFLRIGLMLPGHAEFSPAWLYIPQNSPHRATHRIHEIIASKLDLRGVNEFSVRVDPRSIRFTGPTTEHT